MSHDRAANGARWLMLDMGGVQALSFLVFAILSRFVSNADLGLIAIAFLVTQSVRSLLIDPITMSVVRKEQPSEIEYTTAFWITQVISLFVTILLVFGSFWIERLFNAPGLSPVMSIMSVTIVAASLSRVHEGWMTRNFHFRPLAIRSIVSAVFGALVGIALAIRGWGVMALVSQQIVTSIIALMLMWRACPWRPDFRLSKSSTIEILLFSRSLMTTGILSVLTQNGDTALVALAYGPASAGVFNVAKRVRLALQLCVWTPIGGVFAPSLAEAQGDRVRLHASIIKSLIAVSAICAPIFTGVASIASVVIVVCFGARLSAAGPELNWLAFGGLSMLALWHNDILFAILGRPIFSVLTLSSYVVLTLLSFLVMPNISTNLPIAATFILPFILVVPASTILLLRIGKLPVSQCLRVCLPGIFSSAIMYVCVRGFLLFSSGEPLLLQLVCSILIGGTVYVAALWMLSRQTFSVVLNFCMRIAGRSLKPA